MATPTDRKLVQRSTLLPVFPLELWDIIIEHLREEESAQHLSRLAQTCPALYSRIDPQLYKSVRLFNSESGARLALTIENRPELASLIREIRHKQDTGSEIWSHRHLKFYKAAVTLPNLEKLSLRRNPRPFDSTRWPSTHARDDAVMQWVKKIASRSGSIKEYRDLGYGPPGESSFSPPDDELICMQDGAAETLFWHASLQNPPGLPALRVCHIGSDYNHDVHDTKMDGRCIPSFNEALFCHPSLRKLCITGATCQISQSSLPNSTLSTSPLEELTLLNCVISPLDLQTVLEYPTALKRFTFRGPRSQEMVDSEGDTHSYIESALKHDNSLEYIDYDLYWGSDVETDFGELVRLKHLTTTLATLAGRECIELDPPDDTLPPNLESLTILYDEVKSWLPSTIYEMVKVGDLPKLRRFTCEVPEIIEHLPSINEFKSNPPATEICQEGNTWKSKFAELNVDMSMVLVPYPINMPKYDVCSCECLPFYHRMSYHPHKPLSLPWEDDYREEDVFFEDWADIDDGMDLDALMDDLAEDSDPDVWD
ncbi:hypothetical protein N7489_006689 [Penicillium chrysogenum]|uniref:F-box domain-containing protein n=1 Tax=Penicillium chrysogenum TaxID=5076 RepID=A0ABQ8W490_PENCH|nr:uncharacterized protein N7489_006689 [Penicillium chrysogenum]KAJ5236598.1 hypothetical protein N7489_006689 [Penicillium chrysogenum]KAJ5255501.1 hypothetical protein N7505_010652 [Penicillium chrysogenum]KAJ6152692.1 hypothetical protein N7497_007011 [Penicillium chrysogenum]